MNEFLDDFPTVQRAHAQGVLRFLKQILLVGAYEGVA
jgi:hypothetical protein